MTTRVAFIGLGNMGGPMAANLAKKGYEVHAFDLMEAALTKAKEAGCQVYTNPIEAAANVDVVVSMLPNGTIVEAVYIDEEQLLDKVSADTLLIDCSTVAPANSRRVGLEAAHRGLDFVDAPVSGGTAGAAAGTLAFMCGGSENAFARAKPILEAMGANIFHAGDCGAGSVTKICNNMLLAIHMAGTAEALQLGINNGLDPKVLSDIMLKSSGRNWSLEVYNPVPGVMDGVPSSKEYAGGFMTNLMLKDLGLAAEAAKSSGSTTPMGSLAQSLYAMSKNRDEREGMSDFSKVLDVFK